MELAAEEPWVIGQLNNLYKLSIRRLAREDKSPSAEFVFVARIELVAVTMTLADLARFINACSQRTGLQLARIRAEPHRPAHCLDSDQIAQLEDHRMRG